MALFEFKHQHFHHHKPTNADVTRKEIALEVAKALIADEGDTDMLKDWVDAVEAVASQK